MKVSFLRKSRKYRSVNTVGTCPNDSFIFRVQHICVSGYKSRHLTMQLSPRFTVCNGLVIILMTLVLMTMAAAPPALAADNTAPGRKKAQMVLGDEDDVISVEYNPVAAKSDGPGQPLQDGKIWSPGNGVATAFNTNENLVFALPKPGLPAGQYGLEWRLPAGHYSIYIQPSGKDWVLILSQDTGQSATSYSDMWDIIHAPMRKRELTTPVPKLTFSLEHQGPKGGMLKVSFGKTELSVPFWKAPPIVVVDDD
jgi:hypothetical protein